MATKKAEKKGPAKGAPKETAPAATSAAVELVPLDSITPHPDNPRQFGRSDKKNAGLVELAASIREVGVIEPILLRKAGEGFQLIAGERRWRAARLAGLSSIPALVRDLDDKQALEVLVTENLQREDLHPLEEARGVKALVDGAGWTPADVAAKLGKSLGWVAARVRLVTLSPRWQRAIKDADSPVSEWPLGHLLLVARLEPEAQDELAERKGWIHEGRGIPLASELRKVIADALREIRLAPWKLGDEALFPDAGSCVACAKKSSCHPGLFEEDGDSQERVGYGDKCLDPVCWFHKMERHLEAKEAELRADHPNLILLNGDGGRTYQDGVVQYYSVEAAKKADKGAVPALVVDGKGVGSIRWVKPRSEGSSRSERPKDGAGNPLPKPLTERRAALERRRVVKAVELVKEAIRSVMDFPRPSHIVSPLSELLVPLVATFGTQRHEDSSQCERPAWSRDEEPDPEEILDDEEPEADASGDDSDEEAHEDTQAQGAPRLSLWEQCAALIEDPDAVCKTLWSQVKPVLLSRLAYMGAQTNIEKLEAEALNVSRFLGLNYEAAKQAATEAIRTPKAWASLNEDGTPKKKGQPAPASTRDDEQGETLVDEEDREATA